jgi:hypothetical protein
MKTVNIGLSELHGVTSQKTALFIVTVVKAASATQALIKQEANKFSLDSPPASAGFLLSLLVDPEDGGDIFFRNIGLFLNYTALQLGRPHCLYFVVVLYMYERGSLHYEEIASGACA